MPYIGVDATGYKITIVFGLGEGRQVAPKMLKCQCANRDRMNTEECGYHTQPKLAGLAVGVNGSQHKQYPENHKLPNNPDAATGGG
jgi:hypothetical protein